MGNCGLGSWADDEGELTQERQRRLHAILCLLAECLSVGFDTALLLW